MSRATDFHPSAPAVSYVRECVPEPRPAGSVTNSKYPPSRAYGDSACGHRMSFPLRSTCFGRLGVDHRVRSRRSTRAWRHRGDRHGIGA